MNILADHVIHVGVDSREELMLSLIGFLHERGDKEVKQLIDEYEISADNLHTEFMDSYLSQIFLDDLVDLVSQYAPSGYAFGLDDTGESDEAVRFGFWEK